MQLAGRNKMIFPTWLPVANRLCGRNELRSGWPDISHFSAARPLSAVAITSGAPCTTRPRVLMMERNGLDLTLDRRGFSLILASFASFSSSASSFFFFGHQQTTRLVIRSISRSNDAAPHHISFSFFFFVVNGSAVGNRLPFGDPRRPPAGATNLFIYFARGPAIASTWGGCG